MSTATTELSVRPRSRVDWKALAASVDPSNWSREAPTFFAESTPISQTHSKGGWNGQLHEIFRWNGPFGIKAVFDNVLAVNFRVSPRRIRVDYHLVRSVQSSIGGPMEPGGLDVDSGFFNAECDGDAITVVATKSLRFVRRLKGPPWLCDTLNRIAPATVRIWLDRAVLDGVTRASRGRRPAGRRAALDL